MAILLTWGDKVLAILKKEVFDALDNEALIWACVQPAIIKMRAKSHDIKTGVYSQLSLGQRSLTMFQILYGHSILGIEEFYMLVPHLPHKENIWQELYKAMKYFGADAMMRLILDMESNYMALAKEKQTYKDTMDEKDEQAALMRQLNDEFKVIKKQTVEIIAQYIRKHPFEFVKFEQ